MKLLEFIFLVSLLVAEKQHAQEWSHYNEAGIFKTYQDFRNGQVHRPFKSYNANTIIWPRGFFKSGDLSIQTPDTSLIVNSTKIWGYIDHRNYLIRTFEGRHFKVVCDAGLIIYILYSPLSNAYYFSRTYDKPIYRLSKGSLSLVFNEKKELLDKLNAMGKKNWVTPHCSGEYLMINKAFRDYKNSFRSQNSVPALTEDTEMLSN
jgi:hypothetical protein